MDDEDVGRRDDEDVGRRDEITILPMDACPKDMIVVANENEVKRQFMRAYPSSEQELSDFQLFQNLKFIIV